MTVSILFIPLIISLIIIIYLIYDNSVLLNNTKNDNKIENELHQLKVRQYIIRGVLFSPFIFGLIYCIYSMIYGIDFCMLGECSRSYGFDALGTIIIYLLFLGWIYIILIILIIIFELRYRKKLNKFIKK